MSANHERRTIRRPSLRGALAAVAISMMVILMSALGLGTSTADARQDTAEDGSSQPLTVTTERGPVTVEVTLTPPEPVIGDDLVLTLRARAEKGIELLLPEFGESLERFQIATYEPSETVDDTGATIAVQKYTLLGPRSGKHAIPPLLVEFLDRRPGKKLKPDGEPSYEVITDRVDFVVESVVPAEAGVELAPPLGELEAIVPPPPPRWPWVVGAVALAALATPFLWLAWVAYRRRARRRSAYDIAVTKLDRLLGAGAPAQDEAAVGQFYVELSAIVRRYLEDRFELRAPELTTEEFLDEATQATDLSVDHQRLLQQFLRGADLVKFAHFVPDSNAIHESVEIARKFLDETRENAPLLDIDEDGNDNAENEAPSSASSGTESRHAV